MFNCWVFGSANSVTRPDRDNQYNMRIVYICKFRLILLDHITSHIDYFLLQTHCTSSSCVVYCHAVQFACSPLLPEQNALVHEESSTYLFPCMSLLSESLEMAWPQANLIGGLESDVCCRKIGHAKMEWYLLFMPKSTSIYRDKTRSIENVLLIVIQQVDTLGVKNLLFFSLRRSFFR